LQGNNREIGYKGECIASDYLEKNGYTIIKRNYYTAHGEIDIIATYEKYIVFVEVKTRSGKKYLNDYGRPSRAVDSYKLKNIAYSVNRYIKETDEKRFPRVDVIEIIIEHISDEFISAKINHMIGVYNRR